MVSVQVYIQYEEYIYVLFTPTRIHVYTYMRALYCTYICRSIHMYIYMCIYIIVARDQKCQRALRLPAEPPYAGFEADEVEDIGLWAMSKPCASEAQLRNARHSLIVSIYA